MTTSIPPPTTAIALARAAARRQAGDVKTPISSTSEALDLAMQLVRGDRPAARHDATTQSLYEDLLSAEGLTALDALRDADEALQSAVKLSDLKKRSVLAELAHALQAGTPTAPQTLPQGSFARDTLVHSPAADIMSVEPVVSAATLGTMVRRAREQKGVSQFKLAELAGVGRRFVSELENGKSSLEFDKVLQVAAAAGVAVMARVPS
jgi:y4mF family transcriptional regulator